MNTVIWFKKCWHLTHKMRNICWAFKIIINRDLLDEMLRLFYCLLFPVRASKKRCGNPGLRGVLELGNPGGRGALAVWEIQSGGSKMLAIRLGVYFLWNNPIRVYANYVQCNLSLATGLLFSWRSLPWFVLALTKLKGLFALQRRYDSWKGVKISKDVPVTIYSDRHDQ